MTNPSVTQEVINPEEVINRVVKILNLRHYEIKIRVSMLDAIYYITFWQDGDEISIAFTSDQLREANWTTETLIAGLVDLAQKKQQ